MKRKIIAGLCLSILMLATAVSISADDSIEEIGSVTYEKDMVDGDTEIVDSDEEAGWAHISELIVSGTDVHLTQNTEVTDKVYIGSKRLYLDGYVLLVHGNIQMDGGTIDASALGSQIYVDNDFIVTGGTALFGDSAKVKVGRDMKFEGYYYDGEPYKASSDLWATDSSIEIGRNFVWNSTGETTFMTGNPQIKIYGDFTDKVGRFFKGNWDFCGNKQQTIDMTADSLISHLLPTNPDIKVVEYCNISNLDGNFAPKCGKDTMVTTQKFKINGPMTFTVDCNYVLKQTINAFENGAKLVVNGDLRQENGAMQIGESGSLKVSGDFAFEGRDSLGGPVKASSDLWVTDSSIEIGGDFIWNSTGETTFMTGNPQVKLYGNFTDKMGRDFKGNWDFCGNKQQTIDMTADSLISHLLPTNPDIKVTEYCNISNLDGNFAPKCGKDTMVTTREFKINGPITFTVDCNYVLKHTMNAFENGAKLVVNGDLRQESGTMQLGDNSTVKVSGNLAFEGRDSLGGPVKVSSDLWASSSSIEIGGDFVWNSTGETAFMTENPYISIGGNYTDLIGTSMKGTVHMRTPGKTINTSGAKINKLKLDGKKYEFIFATEDCYDTLSERMLITFDANKGSVGETSRYVYTTEAFGELPVPVRSKYVFLGWFTQKAEESGEKITADTIVYFDEDEQLYAHWEPVGPCFKTTKLPVNVGMKCNVKFYHPAGKVTYKSSNKNVVKVDKNGILTPIKKGKVTITATYKNKKYKCTVTVYDPTITGKDTVKKGKTITLKVKDGYGKTTWKSSNSKIATVDKNGKVKGKKKGTVKITAINNGKNLTMTIRVK